MKPAASTKPARRPRRDAAGEVTLGLLQFGCSADPKTNLKRALALAEQAARKGARIICTPELFRSQYFCQSEDRSSGANLPLIRKPGPKVRN